MNPRTEKGYWAMNMTEFIAPMLKLIQSQKKEIDAIKEILKNIREDQ